MKNVKLYKPREFDKRYLEHMSSSRTNKEAYLKTEDDFIDVFGERRYKNYESFRKTYERRHKRR